MGDLPRYRKIYRLPTPGSSASTVKKGYEYWLSPKAETGLNTLLSSQWLAEMNPVDDTAQIQQHLLGLFRETGQSDELQAQAGLCLRCFVSPAILQACKEQASAFAGTADRQTTLFDLLLGVLDDDGETFFLLLEDGPHILTQVGQRQPASYSCFSLEILSRYDYQSPNRKSLANWAYYVTRYHDRVTSVLNQGGFKRLSDWALMNRARPAQMEGLAERSRHLVAVFQAVYRRDRLKQRQRDGQSLRAKKCPDPSTVQLDEMRERLQALGIGFQSPKVLLEELRQVAKELQAIDLWMRQGRPNAEPIEPPDPETGVPTLRQDIASTVVNEPEALEYEGILQFIREQQLYALQYGLQQGVEDRLTEIRNSRRKAHASKLIPGLKLIYQEGLSQRDICEQLDFPNQPLVARVLAPKDLIHQVRFRTLEKLLDIILVRAQDMGLTAIPPQPDYLSNLMRQLEALVDTEIFEAALQELQNPGKDRSFTSQYADELRRYLKTL